MSVVSGYRDAPAGWEAGWEEPEFHAAPGHEDVGREMDSMEGRDDQDETW